jgi:hypothetical protein
MGDGVIGQTGVMAAELAVQVPPEQVPDLYR